MKINPLALTHDRGTFRCGIPSFDKYFRAQAGRDMAKSLSAVFVAELAGGKVVGYYALSSATVLLPDLLGSGQRIVSRYPELTAARLISERAVRRRSCKVHPVTPHALSKSRLNFEKPDSGARPSAQCSASFATAEGR